MPHSYPAIIQTQTMDTFHFLVPQSNHSAVPASTQTAVMQCSQINHICFQSPVNMEFKMPELLESPLEKSVKQADSWRAWPPLPPQLASCSWVSPPVLFSSQSPSVPSSWDGTHTGADTVKHTWHLLALHCSMTLLLPQHVLFTPMSQQRAIGSKSRNVSKWGLLFQICMIHYHCKTRQYQYFK